MIQTAMCQKDTVIAYYIPDFSSNRSKHDKVKTIPPVLLIFNWLSAIIKGSIGLFPRPKKKTTQTCIHQNFKFITDKLHADIIKSLDKSIEETVKLIDAREEFRKSIEEIAKKSEALEFNTKKYRVIILSQTEATKLLWSTIIHDINLYVENARITEEELNKSNQTNGEKCANSAQWFDYDEHLYQFFINSNMRKQWLYIQEQRRIINKILNDQHLNPLYEGITGLIDSDELIRFILKGIITKIQTVSHAHILEMGFKGKNKLIINCLKIIKLISDTIETVTQRHRIVLNYTFS